MNTSLRAGRVTIRHQDGKTLEGIVLACHGNTMSVAVKGADDAVLFTRVRDLWVSEDCSPVEIEPDWLGCATDPDPIMEQICGQEAARVMMRILEKDRESGWDDLSNFEPRSNARRIQRVV